MRISIMLLYNQTDACVMNFVGDIELEELNELGKDFGFEIKMDAEEYKHEEFYFNKSEIRVYHFFSPILSLKTSCIELSEIERFISKNEEFYKNYLNWKKDYLKCGEVMNWLSC